MQRAAGRTSARTERGTRPSASWKERRAKREREAGQEPSTTSTPSSESRTGEPVTISIFHFVGRDKLKGAGEEQSY